MKIEDTVKKVIGEEVKTRRDFLKTTGKIAVYTPPALMLLMHPSNDAMACNSYRPQKYRRQISTHGFKRYERKFRRYHRWSRRDD